MILADCLMISHFYLTFFALYLTVCDSYLTNPLCLRLSSRENCIQLESSPHRGLPSGRSFGGRPIQSISGLTPKGEVLSYDFGRLSYAYPFLSYAFPLLSYVFHVLSYAPRLLPHRRLLPAQIPPPKKAPSQAAFHWYR